MKGHGSRVNLVKRDPYIYAKATKPLKSRENKITKASIPAEKPKKQRDNTQTPPKTSITQRLG